MSIDNRVIKEKEGNSKHLDDMISAFQMYNSNGLKKRKSKSIDKIRNEDVLREMKLVGKALKRKKKSLDNGGPVEARPKKKQRKLKDNPRKDSSDESTDLPPSVKDTVNQALKSAKRRKSSDTSTSDTLNGDDVPLVEEIMEDMVGDEDSEEEGENPTESGVNGENFLAAVLGSNKEMLKKYNEEETAKKRQKRLTKKSPTKDSEKSKSKKRAPESSECGPDEESSIEAGRKYLEWIINPTTVKQFFKDNWEKQSLHIKRSGKSNYFKDLFSCKALDTILREQNVLFGKNLDITSYDGQRETHNPSGRAYSAVVWDFYNNGCSIRMLNPQTFWEPVWKSCATLQEFFGSMVGANVYLTPPGTQGFAPHFDDVEVFILQLEGKKRWRLYEHRSEEEKLARYSSPNFSQDEIGDPCLDVVLEAGDLLYLPRGTIHQANCLEDTHSLHITISCHQLNTFGDLMLKLIPMALENALEENVEFRSGLPTNYLSYMGVSHSDREESKERKKFMQKVELLMGKLFSFAPIDAACDQMGKRLMYDSLPPYLSQTEKKRTVELGGERWNANKAKVVNRVEIDPDNEIRLVRANSIRLVCEDGGSVRIYYNVENTREYHEMDEQYLEVDAEVAPAIEQLIHTYPKYLKVEDLDMEEDKLDVKMKVIQDLWEKKLIMTREPLEAHYDD